MTLLEFLKDKLSRRISYDLECNGFGQKDLSPTADSSAARELSKEDMLKGWRMSTIETAESDSGDEEFFDAQGRIFVGVLWKHVQGKRIVKHESDLERTSSLESIC